MGSRFRLPAAVFSFFLISHTEAVAQVCTTAAESPARSMLIALLSRADTAKSEFETTDQYQSRIFKILNGVNTVTLSMPFELGHYDADKQTYEITQTSLWASLDRILGIYTGGAGGWLGIDIKKVRSKARTYVGENAFGARTTVAASEMQIYAVAFNAQMFGRDSAPLELSVPIDQAPKVTRSLKLVISGKVVAPFILSGDYVSGPTIDLPIDASIHTKILTIDPTCGAIIDGSSGTVLATFDPKQIHL